MGSTILHGFTIDDKKVWTDSPTMDQNKCDIREIRATKSDRFTRFNRNKTEIPSKPHFSLHEQQLIERQ